MSQSLQEGEVSVKKLCVLQNYMTSLKQQM